MLYSTNSPRVAKSRCRPMCAKLQCEALENRLVPTLIPIGGTSGVDVYQLSNVSGELHVVVTPSVGHGLEYYLAAGDSAEINGESGDDLFVVFDGLPTNIPVTIDGGTSLGGASDRDKISTRSSTGRQWDITGMNSGTLGTITFRSIDDLRCEASGNAGDRFVMHPGGSISYSINGGNKPHSVLDYSLWNTGVTVDLFARTGPGIVPVGTDTSTGIRDMAGVIGSNFNDVITGTSGTQILRGGLGNDTLYGRSGEDILIGGDGNDRLFGEGNRDLLIGGRSSGMGSFNGDQLDGGGNEDILIGGSTSYDVYSWTAHDSLIRIMNVWKDTSSYETRVNALRMGVGGVPRLDLSTVFDDGGNDNFTGGPGRDWFHTEPDGSMPSRFGQPVSWVYDYLADRGFDEAGMPLVSEFVD